MRNYQLNIEFYVKKPKKTKISIKFRLEWKIHIKVPSLSSAESLETLIWFRCKVKGTLKDGFSGQI